MLVYASSHARLASWRGGEDLSWLITNCLPTGKEHAGDRALSYKNRVLHFYSPECHKSSQKPSLEFQMFIIMYLFFSDVPNVGYHRVNSGGLLQRDWRKQVFARGLVLSSHADSKCSPLSKYRCWMISYQLFQQFRTFFINIWRHRRFYRTHSDNSGCCCILIHCRGSWCIFLCLLSSMF